jgi:hypothetical protein
VTSSFSSPSYSLAVTPDVSSCDYAHRAKRFLEVVGEVKTYVLAFVIKVNRL